MHVARTEWLGSRVVVNQGKESRFVCIYDHLFKIQGDMSSYHMCFNFWLKKPRFYYRIYRKG